MSKKSNVLKDKCNIFGVYKSCKVLEKGNINHIFDVSVERLNDSDKDVNFIFKLKASKSIILVTNENDIPIGGLMIRDKITMEDDIFTDIEECEGDGKIKAFDVKYLDDGTGKVYPVFGFISLYESIMKFKLNNMGDEDNKKTINYINCVNPFSVSYITTDSSKSVDSKGRELIFENVKKGISEEIAPEESNNATILKLELFFTDKNVTTSVKGLKFCLLDSDKEIKISINKKCIKNDIIENFKECKNVYEVLSKLKTNNDYRIQSWECDGGGLDVPDCIVRNKKSEETEEFTKRGGYGGFSFEIPSVSVKCKETQAKLVHGEEKRIISKHVSFEETTSIEVFIRIVFKQYMDENDKILVPMDTRENMTVGGFVKDNKTEEVYKVPKSMNDLNKMFKK